MKTITTIKVALIDNKFNSSPLSSTSKETVFIWRQHGKEMKPFFSNTKTEP